MISAYIKSIQVVLEQIPTNPHSAIVCGVTGCGKTAFVFELLESQYHGVFSHNVILCPTVRYNKTYQQCLWIWSVHDPGKQLCDYLRGFYKIFQRSPTLYIIDGCSTMKALTKKKRCFQSWHLVTCSTEYVGFISKVQFSFKGFTRTNPVAGLISL